MPESTTRSIDEIEQLFDQINTLLDIQCKRILNSVDNLDALNLVEQKKLEMSTDTRFPTPKSSLLALKEPKWYDGYRYGLLRGYWRALCWVVYTDDEDLLTEKD